jgi:hypothetical protein
MSSQFVRFVVGLPENRLYPASRAERPYHRRAEPRRDQLLRAQIFYVRIVVWNNAPYEQ